MTVEKKEEKLVKPTCPECGTELLEVNGEMPEECAKCQFPVGSYPTLKRIFSVFLKHQKEEDAAAEIERRKAEALKKPKTAAEKIGNILRKKKTP